MLSVQTYSFSLHNTLRYALKFVVEILCVVVWREIDQWFSLNFSEILPQAFIITSAYYCLYIPSKYNTGYRELELDISLVLVYRVQLGIYLSLYPVIYTVLKSYCYITNYFLNIDLLSKKNTLKCFKIVTFPL